MLLPCASSPTLNSTRTGKFWGYRFVLLCLSIKVGWAVTLDELKNDPKLTPKSFARLFSDFEYVYHSEVQDPEFFLFTRSGDCDDYAILADLVLKPKGYKTKLVYVKMPGLVAHVVCYIDEEKAYLDFNNRQNLLKLERCGPSLRDIATKVAKSFQANWTSVTEFSYEGNGIKKVIRTIAKTDPEEPGKSEKPSSKIKVEF